METLPVGRRPIAPLARRGIAAVLLAADIRNGSIAVGLRKAGERWTARFRLSAAQRSVDEWEFLIASLLASRGADRAGIGHAVLSSVVPSATVPFAQAMSRFPRGGKDPLIVGPGVKTGLRIRTDNPAEVGSDLVCAAVAAVALLGAPCIVVDFGTTLTFTAVDAKGDLVGVALAPGMESAALALRRGAAQLPQIRLEAPLRAIGKNTAESVRAGLMIGWSGLVDRILDRMIEELGGAGVSLVGTGDHTDPPLTPRLGFDLWEPFLALDGLALIHERRTE